MIRLTLLAVFVLFLCVYAWRDWFVALCGLILMTVVSQHPDMPHGVLGIPGLNPWNLVLFVVVVAYIVNRPPREQRSSRAVSWLFAAYCLMQIVGFFRVLPDADLLASRGYSQQYIWNELLINPLKYLLVGYLIYDGTRTRKRLLICVLTILIFCLMHALLIYKGMKATIFLGDYQDARRLMPKLIGLHPIDLAGLLNMGFWSCIVAASFWHKKWRWAAIISAALILPTLIGCQSRAAYAAFIMVGLALGLVRWRRMLLIVPVLIIVAIIVFPQIVERLTYGFDTSQRTISNDTNWNTVSAGRTHNVWAPTVSQIIESPLIGHGLLSICRTGSYDVIMDREGVVPSHPHNSYLEVLSDSGLLGLSIIVSYLVFLGYRALRSFRTRHDPLLCLCGGISFVAVINICMLGVFSDFFYMKESMLWFVCAAAMLSSIRDARTPVPHRLDRSSRTQRIMTH